MVSRKQLVQARFGLAALFFTLGFGSGNWLARIPAIRRTLDLGDRELGFLLLCSSIGAVVAFRTAGKWAGRWQSRELAGMAATAFGFLLFIPAAIQNVYACALALLCSGYAMGLLDVSSNANAVAFERKSKKNVLASLHGCCSLGAFSGAACGTLAASLKLDPLWHLLGVGAVLVAVSQVARHWMLEDPPRMPAAAAPARLNKALLLLGLCALCSSATESAMAQWTAVYLRDTLHTSEGTAGSGYAAFCGAMVTVRLLGDRIAGSWPKRVLLFRCGVLTAVSLSLALVANSPLPTIVFGMGVGAGVAMVIPTVFRGATALPKISAASALATVATLSYGGMLFGPPSIGMLAEHIGVRKALGLVVVLAVMLAALGRRVPGEADSVDEEGATG